MVLHNLLRTDCCAWRPGEFKAQSLPKGIKKLAKIGAKYQREVFDIREKFKFYFASKCPVASGNDQCSNFKLNDDIYFI